MDPGTSLSHPSEVGISGVNGNLFESLKKVNEFGVEYWSARDIQPHLGYTEWRNFNAAVKKAQISCTQSGNEPRNHFVDANKMVTVGSGVARGTADYHLSRFACYLIAQNGDPRKQEVARAQEYFAIQTRRMEISEQLAADMERVELREQATQEFKALSGVAKQAGVQDRMFGVFHDAGYKGMYGGIGSDQIKRVKKISPADRLLDCIGTTELAANTAPPSFPRSATAYFRAAVQAQATPPTTEALLQLLSNDAPASLREAAEAIQKKVPEDREQLDKVCAAVKAALSSTRDKRCENWASNGPRRW